MSDTKSRVTASTRVSRIMQKVHHDKFNSKCVCEICTCGIHRCPPNQKRRFQGHTTNQDTYKPYRIQAQRDQEPVYKVKQRHYDPEALKTTYGLQYTPKKAPLGQGLGQSLRRSVDYFPRKTPFYSETEYNSKFVKRPVVYDSQPIYEYRPNRAKFEGLTSYNAEFTPQTPEKQVQNPEGVYQRRHIPFNGESSYKSQYQKYNIAPTKQEEYVYRPNTAKFLGESRYKQDYHQYPKALYDNAQSNCELQELPPYPRQCSPGKRHLNYSAQKNYWE